MSKYRRDLGQEIETERIFTFLDKNSRVLENIEISRQIVTTFVDLGLLDVY